MLMITLLYVASRVAQATPFFLDIILQVPVPMAVLR